ncbi:MAG: glutamine--fructose-6-phosphate transaminase (isomerizing) [Myxococcota bacterium]
MCGIVGYVGPRPCSDMLLGGLARLEYRGYDSAGIAIGQADGAVRVVRAQGKLRNLERAYLSSPFEGTIGLGHTRWATHGEPNKVNAHPHRVGRIVLAHNGIIENYAELKQQLDAAGRRFESATDTEVVGHLIDMELERGASSLHAATARALERIEGSYALVIMETSKPEELVVARNASPMVLGKGAGEVFAASDVPAVLAHTREFIFLLDGDTAILNAAGATIFDAEGAQVERPSRHINWDPISAEKQGYKHFMLKEIFEQPARIVDTLRGRVDLEARDVVLDEVDIDDQWLSQIDKIIFVACGTSYYASLLGKYLIERHARVPVEVDLASEYRYRDPIVGERTLCIAISQSGETADTLAALRKAKELGAKALSICNVVESTIARESDGVFYTHAGPEIGVASTKAFTTQLAAVGLLTVWLGRRRDSLGEERALELLRALRHVPTAMEEILVNEEHYHEIAREYAEAQSFLYLGRDVQYPIACEGALKLKEISYIHAEGYAAGEMKHGPIALIDEHLPVVVFAPKDHVYDKIVSNLEVVKARGGRVVAIVTEGDEQLRPFADFLLTIPDVDPFIQPMLSVVVAQLLAYHIADFKGTDVDQPRNLAKSVTVE